MIDVLPQIEAILTDHFCSLLKLLIENYIKTRQQLKKTAPKKSYRSPASGNI